MERTLAGLRTALQPRHRRLLALVLAVAAFCNFYQLQQNGFANLYYSAAIRSMLQSWHNFFFVSFDPGGFVTIDKPPLGFWIQTVSAKLLGYSGFSILLPEALAGVLSVAVLYLVVARVFGPPAGLLAALFLAITPISVVTNRNNTIDSLLVLTVLLGAYAISRAVEAGSLHWLLLAAVLVGLGFNIKMLEAYLVLPAFAAAYLLGAPLDWWKRLWRLLLAGVVLLLVSFAWVTVVDIIPSSTRPYVGSSSTNSELELALGYNGLERLFGRFFNLSDLGTAISTASAPGGPGGASENGAAGFFRLFNAQLGGQASWLLALGIVGMFAAGWGIHWSALTHHPAGDSTPATRALSPQQSALVLWGVWTLTQVVFFSVAEFFHRYYLSMLAPGIAALAGIGAVLLWRDFQRRPAGWRQWLLPAALLITALTQVVILADYSGWNSWMTPLIVIGSLLIAGVLVGYQLGRDRFLPVPRFSTAGWSQRLIPFTPLLAVAVGIALLLVGPVTWTAVSLTSAGTAFPAAGPSPASNLVQAPFGARRPGRFSGGFGLGGSFRLRVDSYLVAYLEAHQGSEKFLFATENAETAAPYIIATGKPVMALGGFSGSDPILSISKLQTLIRGGTVRYFLFRRGGGGRQGA